VELLLLLEHDPEKWKPVFQQDHAPSKSWSAVLQRKRRVAMSDLSNYSLPAIFLIGLVVILGATEIGRRLGARGGEGESDTASMLAGAALGLLALMIGFSFAMALSRFEARREAVLKEANAITTTALRARLLPEAQQQEVLRLLQDYVKIRLEFTQRPVSQIELASVIDRSNVVQDKLWRQAMAVAADNNAMVPTGLFIQTLNEMIDDQETRLTAVRNRVPNIVILALFGVAAAAGAFAGYASMLETRRAVVPVYVMGLLVAAVILLILDLDRPGTGFIEVSQQPMIDAANSIAAFSH
jgi:hypothetical protein